MRDLSFEVKVLMTDPHDSTLYAKRKCLGIKERNEER